MNQKEWYAYLEANGAVASSSVYAHHELISRDIVDVYWHDDINARNKYANEMREDGYIVKVNTENLSTGTINSLVAVRRKEL
jgi:hypothetical protein